MAATHYVLVISTFPDHLAAETAATEWIRKKLVGCVNITPLLTSVYEWKGDVVRTSEVMLLMKTHKDKLVALEKELVAIHPYDTPEFVVLPIAYASLDYLKWLDKALR